jgi:hypothetical protein
VSQIGRKLGPDLLGPQVQETVTGAALEGARDPREITLPDVGLSLGAALDAEPSTWRQGDLEESTHEGRALPQGRDRRNAFRTLDVLTQLHLVSNRPRLPVS